MTTTNAAAASQLTAGERQRRMERIVIDHDRSREAVAMLQRAHYPVVGGVPHAGCLSALIGESRVGKSFAVKRYAKQHPPRRKEGGGGIVCPVLVVDVPGDSCRGLLQAMAETLKLSYDMRINIPSLTCNVLRGLVSSEVELLVLDEMQTILSDANRKAIPFMRTFLRKVLNLGTLSIVCVGLEETYALMAADSQLTGRGGLPYESLRSYSWENSGEQKLFRLLCREFDRRLPFDVRSGLEQPAVAHRLFYSTDRGNIGRLKDFLFSAGCLAINDGSERIETAHFAAAYDRIKKPRDTFNPWRDEMSAAPSHIVDEDKLEGPPREIFAKKRRSK